MKLNLIKFYALCFSYQAFKNDQRGVTAIEYGLLALSLASMMFIALFSRDFIINKAFLDRY